MNDQRRPLVTTVRPKRCLPVAPILMSNIIVLICVIVSVGRFAPKESWLLRSSRTNYDGSARKAYIWEVEPDFVYELELMYIGMKIDGKQKNVLSFNGMGAQGPTIRVPMNSIVRVKVINSLPDQGTTLHFHGIHQIGTPFFDGAHGVVQSAIPPLGGSMTYQFRAWPAGTHWYHSHLALQYADGAKGLFIVYDENDGLQPYYDAERYVMFYDWLPKESSAEYYILGQVFGNSMHVKDMSNDQSGDFVNWVPAAGLVNGRPGIRFGDKADVGYIMEVPVGHTVRVRLCFGGWLDKASVSIDGHDMIVVAKDGTLVRNVRASAIVMHPGERFDVLVTARDDAVPGEEYRFIFAIRDHAEFPVDKENKKPNWSNPNSGYRPFKQNPELLVFTRMKGEINATLRYVKAKESTRVKSMLKPWRQDAICDVLDSARDSFSTNLGSARLALDMKKVNGPPKGFRDVLIPVVITGGFKNPTTGDWVMPHTEKGSTILELMGGAQTFSIDQMPLAKRVISNNFWLINNNSYVDSTVPLYISKAKFGLSKIPGFSTLVYDAPLDAVVDILMVAHGNAGVIETHPFHLHGNRFWVIVAAPLPLLALDDIYNATTNGLPGFAKNLEDPPYVDSYAVVTGYYYIFRFKASNPGIWHFHCHFLMHGVGGMQLVINVGQDAQPAAPRMYYDGQDLDGQLCPPPTKTD